MEITAGLAVLVVLVSFHHQVSQLREQQGDMDQLRQAVEEITTAEADTSIDDLRHQLLHALDERLATLEQRLQDANIGSVEAHALKRELEQTRRDTEGFRRRITQDFDRTKNLVDAYVVESRSNEATARGEIVAAKEQIAALTSSLRFNPRELTESMILPTVQLNGDDTVGSGTLVFSDRRDSRSPIENYVLTAHHVVRNILADTPRARRDGFDVTIYLSPTEQRVVKGKLVVSRPDIDTALIKLDTEERFPHVAELLSEDDAKDVEVWDPVYAVGCPLGNDPVPSNGSLSSLQNKLNGTNYWMINAPTYFGNSGGGVYLAYSKRLMGVFSKIYTHGKGQPVVIPHMGLCTPMPAIYDWLREEDYGWLVERVQVKGGMDVEAAFMAAPIK